MGLTVTDPYAVSNDCPYGHEWVAGMMCVDSEDVDSVAANRHVECAQCEAIYDPPAV